MKKIHAALAALALCATMALAGCSAGGKEETPPPASEQQQGENTPVYKITASETEITVHEDDLAGYPFASLFSATFGGKAVSVAPEWLDLSGIAGGNDGVITCRKEGASASVTVHVQKAVYAVTAAKKSVDLFPARVKKYDYKSLFTVTRDGKQIPVTEDMISSDVAEEAGTYHYTVTAGGVSETVTVNVEDGHYLEIVSSYPQCTLTLNELNSFDKTSLFTLYVDDEIARVTPEMVNAEALEGAVVGGEYEVTIFYETEDKKAKLSKSATVRIVEEEEILLSHRDEITYPNSAILDLTKLFTITAGGKQVEVTRDMISGEVDYTTAGDYPVTLSYGGLHETATVKVQSGVVIRYKRGAVVQIRRGTDQRLYDFGADFEVVINGTVFENVNFCVDASAVDFSTAGDYGAIVSIDYNTAKLLMGTPPAFTTVTKEITYRVVENEYTVRLESELITLPAGTESYNVFSNVSVFINGIRNTITDNRDWVIVNVCYGKLLSEPVDFHKKGEQTVTLALYVNGIGADEGSDPEPVIVSYKLIVESDIMVSARDAALIEGTTFYTRDLFTITENGEPVEVKQEYVSGKVDVFTPGTYSVSISYEGMSATAVAVVYDKEILGVYHTRLRTFARPNTGGLMEDYDDEATFVSKRLNDLVFSGDGTLTVNGIAYEITEPVDSKTMRVKNGSNTFTLHYADGIIILAPENETLMQLTNERRPYVYFNEDVYDNDKYVAITYSTSGRYVLSSTTGGNYTIEAFHLVSEKDGSEKWYALYVKLSTIMNSNWYYDIDWGEIEFAEGFELKAGVVSYAELNGVRYDFRVQKPTLAVIERTGEVKKYAGMTFTGTVDGKAATLAFNSYQHVTFKIGSDTVLSSLTSTEIDAMKNGGFDYDNDELFLYLVTPEGNKSIYSYKFKLDTKMRTFTLCERDGCFGKYEYANKYIYLDGYGSGHICFDTASEYVTTLFDYTVRGNEIDLTYRDTLQNFAYGSGASFYLAPLGNVLTIKSFSDHSVPDTAAFTNAYITDGAIIRYSVMTIGAIPEADAVNEIYKNIQIVTSEGVLSGSALKNSKTVTVDLTRVQYGTEGFYRIQIKVPFRGKTVTVDYAVEIVSDRYASNALAQNYGAGVLNPSNSVSIGKNGLATVATPGAVYNGYAILSDNAFVIKAKDASGGRVTAEGVILREGLIRVSLSGAESFTDYFTTGTLKSAGGDGSLHVITVNGDTFSIYAGKADYLGNVYEEEEIGIISGELFEAGCVLKIGSAVVKLVAFGDMKNGLLVSDSYRGTYTAETGGETLVLDGFGALSLGGAAGRYMLHDGNRITVILPDSVAVYRLSTSSMTYQALDYALDNTLVEGKKMSASVSFTAEEESYRAETVLDFQKEGVVNVSSSSDYQGYGSVIAGTGTYSLSGNTLTITVNSYTIVFNVPDVITVNRIVCTSTNVSANSNGYFAKDTEFTLYTPSSGGTDTDDDYPDIGGGDWDDSGWDD